MIRIAIITAIVAASATTARASTPCSTDVHGHVVDALTHEPVAGAIVTVGDETTQTDEDGRFAVDGLCEDLVWIEVSRADYQPIEREVVAREGTASVEIELHPLGGEVIMIVEDAPAPVEMQATAVIDGEALERTRGKAFADTLAEVPGVSPLRSASGMAKPIVRGQYGRRLLILVDGVRHRSQEWGLDHAPEIDPFIADRLTVVRGAAGVRHGPDAIGGAVLVDPPPLLTERGAAGELHLIGTGPSNARGGSLAGRLQVAASRRVALQLHGSLRRHAAPTTPDYALDNTGSDEWSLGASAGYRRGRGEYRLSYSHYQAALGVCSCLRIESADDFFEQLERARPADADLYRSDFEIERPYQDVGHDLGLARAAWRLGAGKLTATYALQYDHRREFDLVRDATTGPQFDFRLTTHDADVVLEHDPIHVSDHLHLRGAAGAVGMVQVHAYGGLPLVPDHEAVSAGAYLIERLVGHEVELEAGLRYDVLDRTASIDRQDYLRLVRSDQLPEGACGFSGQDPVECHSTYHTVSASLGALRQLTREWALKADLSTASRPPNPDEQYMNGTSPTFPVLGLGKPDLGAETTWSGSVTTSYQSPRFTAELSAYANLISDYIYFAPALDENGDPIFDVLIRGTFPRFVTRPVDARYLGFDGGFALRPHPTLEVGAQAQLVSARNRTDDSPLVFVPPARFRGSATYTRDGLWGLREAFVSLSLLHVTRQTTFDLAADFAEPPDAYTLVGGELGLETGVDDQTIKIALQGTNLFGERYRDYTSLLRYFVDQPGRQLMLRLSMHFEE